MRQEGVADAAITHFVDVCYIGQSYHLEVPLGAIDATVIYNTFLAAHARVYGHSTNVPAKIVNLRTVHQESAGTVATHAAASPAPRVHPGRGPFVSAPDRSRPRSGGAEPYRPA